jgi:hypothetical protein
LLPQDAALAALAGLVLKYPEREVMIRQMVKELDGTGTDVAQIEWLVNERIKEIEPQILEERAERMRRIHDPETRASVVPLTDFEAELIDKLDDADSEKVKTEAAREKAKLAADEVCAAKKSALAAKIRADRVKAKVDTARFAPGAPAAADRYPDEVEACAESGVSEALARKRAAEEMLKAARERVGADMTEKKSPLKTVPRNLQVPRPPPPSQKRAGFHPFGLF